MSCDALVLQGGGALGAYEWGIYEVFHEKGFSFDVLAGVSIGAINAAIIASRGREASTYLGRFWDEVSDPMADVAAPNEAARSQLSAWKALYLGNPHLFVPRWVLAPWTVGSLLSWTGLYDPLPLRSLLERVVDFRALAGNARLLITAVDIQSGEVVTFDTATTRLTPDHLLASGALPPAFPPVRLGDRWYWDGGLVSNTPARQVLRALPPERRRRLVVIELFPRTHQVPTDLLEVLSTAKDLAYMSKVSLDTELCTQDEEFRALVQRCETCLPPAEAARLREMPAYRSLNRERCRRADLFVLTHGDASSEMESKDYDFSPTAIHRHREEGRRAAVRSIRAWEARPDWVPFGLGGVTEEGKIQ